MEIAMKYREITVWSGSFLFIIFTCCSAGLKNEDALKNAADEAQSIAGDSYESYKVLTELAVSAGEGSPSLKITLEEGLCYRIIAVRSGGASSEEVKISFSHSKQVVEEGADFYELSSKNGDLRNKRVIWGFCVWPALVGELEIYNNLALSGGYILVISAKAETLSWKDGKDVRLFLKGTGTIDLKEMEKKEIEPKLRNILSKDHMNVPPPLEGKAPIFYEIISTSEPSWEYTLTTQPMTCYHFLLASLNCITQYKIVNVESDKVIYDDGAPDDVGRSGWIHDFCLDHKHKTMESSIQVNLKMASDEFEHYWFALAIYGYGAEKKEIKTLKLQKSKERKKINANVKKCEAGRSRCNKGCIKKKGKIEDQTCKYKCLKQYTECTETIQFEGEMLSSDTDP